MKIDKQKLVRLIKPKYGFTIFIICLIISILSWVSLKLSKEYYFQLKIKIEYTNIPEGVLIEKTSDSLFQVTIKKTGFNILSPTPLYQNPVLLVDVSSLIKKDKKYVNYSSKLLISLAKNQLNINAIDSYSPDSLTLIYNKKASKKVPVISLVTYDTQRQFFNSDSTFFTPDSVWVYGIENEVSKINYVTTKLTHLSSLNTTFIGQFPIVLQSNSSTVQVIPSYISYVIPIEKYTESVVSCKINREQNEDYELKTFPNIAEITYYVGLSKYKSIVDSNFCVVADLSKATSDNRAPLIISKKPRFVKIIKIKPEMVEFIKIKR